MTNKTSEKRKMGRPKAEIDWNLFEQLCGIQCTQSEMASMLKINVDTLRDRVEENYNDTFSTIYKKFTENGKCSLRRNQFALSKTNTAMAIWLGKQWLGQTDTPTEVTFSSETMAKFNAVMSQLSSLQSARKMDLMTKQNESKS